MQPTHMAGTHVLHMVFPITQYPYTRSLETSPLSQADDFCCSVAPCATLQAHET